MKNKNLKNPLFWSTIILGLICIILFYRNMYHSSQLALIKDSLEEYSIYYDDETKELSGSGIDDLKYSFDDDDDSYSSSSSSYSYSSSSSSSSSTTTTSSSEPFDPSKYEAVDFNAWNHDDIELGKRITFSGKVLQMQTSGGDKVLRIAIDDDYDKVALAVIDDSDYKKVIAEDDHITVYGLNSGLTSYETVLGAEKTIPSVLVSEYEASY